MATITKPMALDESFKTTETTPRNIADVLAEMGEAIAHGMGRQANEVSYDNTTSGLSADDVQDAIDELADEKVDKVTGKGLSTNDYTDAEKTKLAGIEQGAEVNVQADWAQTDSSADDFIKNKQLVTEPIEELQNDVQSTQTVSGNPITLTDCAPINAEKLVVELEPKQDLHGYDYPYVGGAGKNKLPMTVDGIKAANIEGTWSGNVYTHNGVSFTVLTDSDGNVTGIKANGTASAVAKLNILGEINNGTYLLNGVTGGVYDTTYWGILVQVDPYSYMKNIINGDTSETELTQLQYIYGIRVASGYTANNVMFYPMIRLSTETDPTFAPYSNICPITGYTQTSVEGCGKNLHNKDGIEYGYGISSTTYQKVSSANSWMEVIPWNSEFTTLYLKVFAKGTYTGSFTIRASEDGVLFNTIVLDALQFSGISDGYNTTLSVPTGTKYIAVYGWMANNDSGHYIATANIEVSNTENSTTYSPYASTSATIQFGQTVYGGIVDFNTGIVKPYPEYASYNGETLTGHWISDRDVYAEGTTPTTGAQVVNDGVYDTDIQCAPAPLRLLKGTNNLSAYGVMQIGYQPDNVIGEVKGEIEQHLEMPYLRILDNDADTEVKNYRLYYRMIASAYTLVNLAEMLQHRFLFVEVIQNPSGTANHTLLHSALIDPRTIDGFEYQMKAGTGDAVIIESNIAENKFDLSVRYTGTHTSGDPTDYYVTIRLVD